MSDLFFFLQINQMHVLGTARNVDHDQVHGDVSPSPAPARDLNGNTLNLDYL